MLTEAIVCCPACGAKNRVTSLASTKTAVCGRCRTPLKVAAATSAAPPAGVPIVVTDATFAALVERSPLPVLVDLWAPWCGPCRMLAPAIEQVAKQFAGRATVAKLNTDDNQRTAGRFKANAIPLMIILKDGREVDRLVGLAPATEIARRLEAQL